MSGKRFGVVLMDPPWRYSNARVNGAAEKHYPTMSLEELVVLPVPSLMADDAVFLLWATWPQLADALHLIEAYQCAYVSGFPWVKVQSQPTPDLWGEYHYRPAWGTGFWVRACSELLLIARRGSPRPPTDPPLGLISLAFEHSRKPDNIYQYAEQFPGPYCELFARRRRHNWDAFGNQVEGSIALPAGGAA